MKISVIPVRKEKKETKIPKNKIHKNHNVKRKKVITTLKNENKSVRGYSNSNINTKKVIDWISMSE